MKTRICLSRSWLFPVLLFQALPAWPQASTGTVSGTVRDESGGVIPAANVTLTNVATDVTSKTITNEVGYYLFPAVVPVRRYPFCMAKVTLDKVEHQNRLICVESDYAEGEGGEALFDPQGQPIEKWKGFERLITEYEADLERVNELCAILGDYGLLEPFTMQATLNQGGAMQLTGMHRAAEPKLEALNAAQLKNLLKKGILGRIYAHLLSIDNFARLLDRRAARAA